MWMANLIRTADIVVVIVTPLLARYFGAHDAPPEHQGVQWEAERIAARLYYKNGPGPCPIVPVAAVGMPLDDVPDVLSSLRIERLNLDDVRTLDRLAERIRCTIDGRPTDPGETAMPSDAPDVPDELSSISCRLRAVAPSAPEAVELVKEWLAGLSQEPLANLLRLFLCVERIVKAHGRSDLMRDIVDAALQMLRITDSTTDQTYLQASAQMHILGRAWHLRRTNQLGAALDAANTGIRHAKRAQDHHTEWRGYRCLARIYRKQAETDSHGDRARLLSVAERHAHEALSHFPRNDASEIAMTHYVLVQIEYARYRLLNDRTALQRALRRTEDEPAVFPPDNVRGRISLAVLGCHIHTALGHFSKAQRDLDHAFDLLGKPGAHGAAYEERRGHAYLAQAELLLFKDGAQQRRQIDEEIDKADVHYQAAGLTMDNECDWARQRIAVVAAGMSVRRLRAFERQVPDLATRSVIVRTYLERLAEAKCRSWWSRRKRWRAIVRRFWTVP